MDCLDCGAVLACSKCHENAYSCNCKADWYCPICDVDTCTSMHCNHPAVVSMLDRDMKMWAQLCELHFKEFNDTLDRSLENPSPENAKRLVGVWARARPNPLTGRPYGDKGSSGIPIR